MKAQSLVNEIRRRGGTAAVKIETIYVDGVVTRCLSEAVGSLNGYDISMKGLENSYFTVRLESKRNAFDAGSDYNPGGYDFCHRLRELDYFAPKVAA